MEKKSILITNSGINTYSGGGIVSLNLLEVLKSISSVKLLLCNQHFPGGYENIPTQCPDPRQFGYDDPFFYDYFANSMVREKDFDLAITYGCPFGETVRTLKKESFSKVICDLAPHNIKISMEEHLRFPPYQYPFPHLTNQYLLGLYLKQLQLADKVIVHSHSSAEYIKKEALLTELPTVIPHGTYIPGKIPAFPDKFTPCYMGSLGADKGVVHLFRAIINSKPEIKLLIGGREAQNFNIEDKYKNQFTVYGPVDNLYDFYKNTSVGIFPSVTEGFGICGLECLAHGRPIITTPGTGISELITEKEGFVVPIRDSNAIKEKVEWFAENPSEILRMGKNAHQLASKFDWKNIKKQYVEVCNAVCSID